MFRRRGVRADVGPGFTKGEGGIMMRGLSGRRRVVDVKDSVEAEDAVERVDVVVDADVVVVVESVDVCRLRICC